MEDYKNDNISVHVEKSPGCGVKLEIDIKPKACQAAWLKAIKIINKEVSLPGFRKGKAPNDIIEKQYGKHIDQEWRDCLIQTGYKEAMELTEIYPLNKETIKKPEIKKADKEKGANIVIEYECGPDIPEIKPKDLKIKSQEADKVTQKDIDESLENLRLQQAEWKDITDRPVKKSDYIDIDIEDIDRPGHFLCKDMRFEVKADKMGKWMADLVLGKNIGEIAEGVSEKSKDINPDVEFKPTKCRITIKAIKEATLPEVNDELAKKLGAETKELLLERIEKSLEKQAGDKVKNTLRMRLEEKLIETYPFDVPNSLVQREIKNRMQYVKTELEKSGKTADEIKQNLGEMQSKIEREITNSLRMLFISRYIADKNNIDVSKDELLRELMMQLYSKGTPLDTSIDSEEARNKVYMDLLSQKVKDNLLEKIVIE